MQELHVIKRYSEGKIVLSLNGEIDIYNADGIRAKIYKEIDGYHQVIIDLKNLNYIDSTGLAILIGLLKCLRGKNGSIVLNNPKPQVMKLLKTTGLNEVFDVREEVDQLGELS